MEKKSISEQEMRRRQLLGQKMQALAERSEFPKMSFKERTQIIAEKITELRKETGLTQKELCDSLEISSQTYAGYESGRHEPKVQTLINLANFYNVSMDYILGRYDGIEDTEYKDTAIMEHVENIVENATLEDLQMKLAYFQYELDQLKSNTKNCE